MPDRKTHLEVPSEYVQSRPIVVRGRGKKFARPNYSAHADFLRERTAAVSAEAEAFVDSGQADSVFLQVRTPDELPAAGERKRLKSAGFEIVELSSIDPSAATVQIPKRQLRGFQRKVEKYASTPDHVGKSYLSVIEDLGPVPAEEKISVELLEAPDEPVDCLLVFYSTLTDRERAAILFAVRSYMGRTNATLGDQRRLSNGVTIVEAKLRPSEAKAAGAAFSTLRQILPNHVFYAPDAWRISGIGQGVTVHPPRLATAVAVVDTGVSPNCVNMAGVVSSRIPHLPPGAVSPLMDHGTFVGSRIVYGDDLEVGLQQGVLEPLCPLVDVPVMGADSAGRAVGISESHLASALDAVLPRLPANARVVNISLGTNRPIADGQVSVVAQIVDEHARKRDLLVVTTAGNIRDPRILAAFPRSLSSDECRIDSPGESPLALTVGSIAKYHDRQALSGVREVSAFSRRGPGPFGGIKPDLVAHGGNCLADGSTHSRISTHGLMPSGLAWACDFGTSFAAPLVAGMGAALFDHYGGPKAILVKALLLHFVDPAFAPSIGVSPTHLIGLGEPNLDAARWSRDEAAAYIHVGVMRASHFTYVPFWVPSCLAPGAGGSLRIRATVVLDPPVNPDNAVEYVKSRMTVALRKPAEVGHRTVGVSSDLVQADKWCPVTHMNKQFARSYGTGEWELQLRLWTRDLPAEFEQNYAVIIEVIDESGRKPVRADAEAEGGAHYKSIVPHIAA